MSSQTKINPATIKKILNLAKLDNNPSEEELELYSSQIESILQYADELKEVDTSMVKATDIIPTCFIEDLREDEFSFDPNQYQKVRQNIITNFPKRQGDLLVLPIKVVE
jgi:aspartyl/glutamyl-tRNA(Asn/Gln) amidotransferase C subunit